MFRRQYFVLFRTIRDVNETCKQVFLFCIQKCFLCFTLPLFKKVRQISSRCSRVAVSVFLTLRYVTLQYHGSDVKSRQSYNELL